MTQPVYSIYTASRAAYPTLPNDMQRDGFLRLVGDVARKMFDLPDEVVATFRAYAERTLPSAFTDPNSEPVCYQQQIELAADRGVSADTLRRHEARLVRAGLIERRTMANGARSGYSGCGIYFSAAISLVPQMAAYRERERHLRQEAAKLRGRISAHKGHTKDALERMANLGVSLSRIAGWSTDLAAWPDARHLRRMTLEALTACEEACDKLATEIAASLEKTANMHGQDRMNAAPYIQDTTQDISVTCNDTSRTWTSSKPSKDRSPSRGPSQGLEIKTGDSVAARKDQFVRHFTLDRLYSLSGDNMKHLLDIRTAYGQRRLSEHDFWVSSWDRAAALGISANTVERARADMGGYLTALCIIITDAQTSRPNNPVQNAGGYLRALMKAHQSESLNIIGSMIGLSERSRAAA